MTTSYDKAFISLRYWMLGRNMHTALGALEFASKFHTGRRKDGVTPEYYHQLSIAMYIRTIESGLLHPEETLAAACLHDVCEDYDVGLQEIESIFGSQISVTVNYLTKKHRGEAVPINVYYDRMATDPIASVVKGADRINNLGSMIGVFTIEKQKAYIEETKRFVIPMLKTARRCFTKQEPAYMNLKFCLMSQIDLIQAIHEASHA